MVTLRRELFEATKATDEAHTAADGHGTIGPHAKNMAAHLLQAMTALVQLAEDIGINALPYRRAPTRSRTLVVTDRTQRRSSFRSNGGMATSGSAPDNWREWRRSQALRLKRQGWHQRDIAEALDVSEEIVSRWLARAHSPGGTRSTPRPSLSGSPF